MVLSDVNVVVVFASAKERRFKCLLDVSPSCIEEVSVRGGRLRNIDVAARHAFRMIGEDAPSGQ